MTRTTISNEVVKLIRFLPVITKATPGDDMVHVQSLAILCLCNPASLTCMTIALPGLFRLYFPIWPSMILMPAKPSGALFTSGIARFALPFLSTRNPTKVTRADLARLFFKRDTAGITSHKYALVLRMISALQRVFAQPFSPTGTIAKVMFQSFYTIELYHHRLAAVVTRNLYLCRQPFISTSDRTISLMRMASWWLEHFATGSARLRKNLTSGFVRANDRTKPHDTIRSFFDWLATMLTRFHTLNYRQNRRIVKYA